MPPVGLLNDPNGVIYWKGSYHVFFQWQPFQTGHGAKFWGHYTTQDVVNWKREEIALAPSDWFDKNGCYSGSAVTKDDRLYLFYTGNVRDQDGNRETYQCLAVSDDGLSFEKKGVVARLPEGYTAHFRDPKVWEHEGTWYMVIGAQTENLKGQAVLFASDNLSEWRFLGPITGAGFNGLDEFGYMWECPDLFSLQGSDVLIVSPQGLEADGFRYQNVYQSGYFVGRLDYNKPELKHGEFTELDQGFDFYAPQTLEDDQGRRILFAWMAVPDQDEGSHPTIDYHWIHCMTLPRQLTLSGQKLIQQPLPELKAMRRNEKKYTSTCMDHLVRFQWKNLKELRFYWKTFIRSLAFQSVSAERLRFPSIKTRGLLRWNERALTEKEQKRDIAASRICIPYTCFSTRHLWKSLSITEKRSLVQDIFLSREIMK